MAKRYKVDGTITEQSGSKLGWVVLILVVLFILGMMGNS
jgi:hypothetical protein